MRRKALVPFVLVLAALLAFAIVRHDLTVCTGLTLDRPYTPMDTGALRRDGGIRLVPIGGYPAAALETLAGYYRQKYGVPIEQSEAVPVPPAAFNAERRQFDAAALIHVLRAEHPQPADGRLIVIGLVDEDMFIPTVNWRYALSYRAAERYAVVSRARMGRGCLGLVSLPPERTDGRVRKMVSKNVGLLYFRLEPSDDPRSVLYGNIGGTQELDRMTEEF